MNWKAMLKQLRIAIFVAAIATGLGTMAQAQRYDDDGYYHQRGEAREQGYRRGYDDGARRGQVDLQRGHRFKFKNDDWEDSRGYERWMGDKHEYKSAYRNGYERGYREAYNNYGNGYRDRDGYRDHDDWR